MDCEESDSLICLSLRLRLAQAAKTVTVTKMVTRAIALLTTTPMMMNNRLTSPAAKEMEKNQ